MTQPDSDNGISDLINEIIASSDYAPTSADLEWTRGAVEHMKKNNTHWATPGAGCIIIFDHENSIFTVGMNGAPSIDEILNFARIRTNLIVLGFSEELLYVIPDTTSTDDILRKAGNSQEQILNMIKRGKEQLKEIDEDIREEQ